MNTHPEQSEANVLPLLRNQNGELYTRTSAPRCQGLFAIPNIFPGHKKALAKAARAPSHPEYAKSNDDLDQVIERIKAEQPELFLTAEDLPKRCFVHAPANSKDRVPVPYARALRKELTAQEVLEQVRIQQMREPA